MSHSDYQKNARILKQMMHEVGMSDLRQLSRIAGVSQLQLQRLQYGLLPKMQVETLLKISRALQVELNDLLETFEAKSIVAKKTDRDDKTMAIESLKIEYQRLQQQMERQREVLKQEFQQSSLQALESWLLQWPTAAAAARKNDRLPAVNLLPLLKPVEQLLKQWGIETIGAVDEELVYDPQWHQSIEGIAKAGDKVKVRYVGYRQGDKLLYRAKVSPIKE